MSESANEEFEMSTAGVEALAGIRSVAPLPQWVSEGGDEHKVHFYREDSFLIEGLSRFIGTAIIAGDAALVIATKAHRDALSAQLRDRGLNLQPAIRNGRFLSLDAAEIMGKIMVNGQPDVARFTDVIGGLITKIALAAAQGKESKVAIFGEIVALLVADGRQEAAIRLEQLWNGLAETHSFQLHCAYPMHLFSHELDGRTVEKICMEHSHAFPAEQYRAEGSDQERLRAIVLLQQKAEALKAEIQERKRFEQVAREQEAELKLCDAEQKKTGDLRSRLAAIVDSSDDAIISKDLNGIITSWNKSAECIFGYKLEEIVGKPITLLIPPELQSDEVRILANIRAGKRIDHFQTVRIRKNGDRFDVSVTISPVKDESGKIIGAAKILRDITQQKKLEASLHTTERLASVGRLAATVAHEINNPLEAVTNYVYLATHQPEISDETRGYLTAADQELRRVAHIARQTLGFYRDNSQPMLLVVAKVIEDVLGIYELRFKYKSLKIEQRIEPGLTVYALQGELKQILSNLIANAIDASREDGRIVIAARMTRHFPSEDCGVRITIADNGSGIADKDKSKLFVPFFTTKEAVGTGLGLWITKDLLQKRGGNIRFRSSNDSVRSGTVMSIFLPAETPDAIGPLSGDQADINRSASR